MFAHERKKSGSANERRRGECFLKTDAAQVKAGKSLCLLILIARSSQLQFCGREHAGEGRAFCASDSSRMLGINLLPQNRKRYQLQFNYRTCRKKNSQITSFAMIARDGFLPRVALLPGQEWPPVSVTTTSICALFCFEV